MKLFKLFLFLFITLILTSCSTDDKGNEGYSDVYNLPLIPYNYSNPNFPNTFTPYVFSFDNTPSNNTITNDIVTLGRVLFYDKNMSSNNTTSCASCHKQEFGFSDNASKSIGFNGSQTFRNTMGFANVGFY